MESNTSFNSTVNIDEYGWLFIATGAVHLALVVVPVLTLGPLLILPFLCNKKLRDPVSLVFMLTIALTILAPLSYGILMDISLITNLELFGSCEQGFDNIFYTMFAYFHQQLLLNNALLCVVQHTSVRWGTKKLASWKTLLIVAVLFLYSLAGSFVVLLRQPQFQLRGSLCASDRQAVLYIGVVAIVCYSLPSVVLIILFSILTLRYIKKNMISNQEAVKRLIKIVVSWMIVSIIVRFLATTGPFTSLFLPSEVSAIYSFIGFYAAELNYPLFLFLSFFLHKTAREALTMKLKRVNCVGSRRKEAVTTNTSLEGASITEASVSA